MDVTTITPGSAGETANAYLARGDQVALVDVGTSPHIVDAITEYSPLLNSLVLTHRHREHAEMLERVCQAFDVDVYAFDPPEEIHPALRHAVGDGDTVRIGDEAFEARHTPSHSSDHVVYIGRSAVFSGDLILPDGVATEADRYDLHHESPGERVSDLERLLADIPETVDTIYSGHGSPIRGDVRPVIEEQLDRIEGTEPVD